MTEETKRLKCPNCGNNDRRKIKEEPNKSEVLYYSIIHAISA
jgi:exosome complex RNA-binding protein Csl4